MAHNHPYLLHRFMRCNQLPECEHAEDESDCSNILVPEGYNFLVPVAAKNDLLDVNVTIELEKMLLLNPVDSSFTIKMNVWTNWSDSRNNYFT